MPKKPDLTIITSSHNINHNTNCSNDQKKTAPTPKKKLLCKNSIIWLEEAYNSATSETALWVAVISQAMVDALSKSKKTEAIYQKNEAINWLTSNSKDFIDVCVAASMNPDYVRKKAKYALSNPSPWRAEAGKGKRYEERREYRKKQRLKEKLENSIPVHENKVISIF